MNSRFVQEFGERERVITLPGKGSVERSGEGVRRGGKRFTAILVAGILGSAWSLTFIKGDEF